jgi:uncharacterized protein (UPF0332 family)
MTRETEAFLRKARRSLKASEVLLEQDLAEDAATRAYYATFSAAKALLIGKARPVSKHSHVAFEFEKQFVLTGIVEARFLDYLQAGFMTRHFAEYETDLTRPVSVAEARERLTAAREFVNMAESFLKGAGGESEKP